MASQEGIDEWMATYNAEIRAGMGTPVSLPAIPGVFTQHGTSGRNAPAGKAKREMAKSSRKQNRPKK
ncbi:hypothetical protein ccbrp13_35210 [Ktedonobacteria bacterium brp13]|nr:hypothetical protein ccbrp13_35210 [Ktedonobacteria bacterium brp13]